MTHRFSTAAISTAGKGLLVTALLLGTVADVATAAGPMGRADSAQAVKDGHRRGRGHHRLDLEAAAAELGTTQVALREALGLPDREERRERGRERFTSAAAALGVTEAQLRDALGVTLDGQGRPQRPQTRPDLAAVASELDVTEAELRAAFGFGEGGRGRRPRLDIAGAAEQFGVSEAELRQVLGLRERGDRRGRQ